MPGSDDEPDDRIVVVTGGASGIGAAIVTAFASHGATVAILDANESAAVAHAQTLGARHLGRYCDVTLAESVQTATAQLDDALGRIDVLVNSAGIVRLAPAETLTVEDWEATIAVNLRGTFLMSQAIGRIMLRHGGGRIINLASQAARVALDQHVAYCASKAGVVAVTRALASEWGGRGITVNAISPTIVLTELGRAAWAGPRGDAMLELIPTGRFGEPEEIAATAEFLASEHASMINGVDLAVDGGYTIR
jgi:NAD(P)-dependent dehydrogenase (short-subunit alcohol dehydrogenase family)